MTPVSDSAHTIPTIEPTIVARDAHPISRKQISHNALRVLYRLNEAGYDAYLVGGAVRDLLIGGHPKDFDVATNATPEQVKAQFRNCRLIGRRFRLAHVMYGQETIEVATFRANSDDGTGDRQLQDGRILRDNVYGSIEDDAVRRDFTVNALYYGVRDFSVRDFVGGWADVQSRTLRLIGDPEQRYREDPVRMLRAVRLATKLGFHIDAASADPIPALAPLLADAPPARLFDEMLKVFLAGFGEASFQGLEQHGLLPALLPETARALKSDTDDGLRTVILAALASTDRRVREGKSVTPAFLFAALLWPAFRAECVALQAQGLDPLICQQRAADRVTLHQAHRIALPRRFSIPMQEIWLLQQRFGNRQRKRVFRTLAHPRFRAAYDFLELRVLESPELAEELAFWREAQTLSPELLANALQSAPKDGDDDASDEPQRRKRRRRRRRGGSISGEGASGEVGSESAATVSDHSA